MAETLVFAVAGLVFDDLDPGRRSGQHARCGNPGCQFGDAGRATPAPECMHLGPATRCSTPGKRVELGDQGRLFIGAQPVFSIAQARNQGCV